METLLHEMIHAYLFVTDGNDDHDGHGPAFHTHMHRINKAGLFFFDTFVGASAHFGVNFVIKNEHPSDFSRKFRLEVSDVLNFWKMCKK